MKPYLFITDKVKIFKSKRSNKILVEEPKASQFFELIRKLIEEGDTEKAINNLLQETRSKAPVYYRNAMLLSNQINTLNEAKVCGTISWDIYQINKNRITESTIHLLEKLLKKT